MSVRFAQICAVLSCAAAGCAGWQSARGPAIPPARSLATLPATQFSQQEYVPELRAHVTAPAGWQPRLLSGRWVAAHEVWVSPSGKTAFGVARFTLPIPLGPEPALWFFLQEMQAREGVAILLEKTWDPEIRGLRFVAEGSKYKVRTTLTIRGLTGWIAYAGTLRDQPVEPLELQVAEAARDQTRLGK